MGRSTASKPQPFDYSEPALALADMLAGKLRGTTAAATGFYGDIEDLVRKYGKGLPANVIRALLPTREGKETLLPTVEEMNAMLPPVVPEGAGRSTQMADIANTLGMANPLAPTAGAAVVKGAKVAAPIIKAGALDLARSEPARRAINNVAKAAGVSPMEIMAYQGSPHKFAPTEKNPLGEFDSTKIGSGEGAQAYGHGHYLAESPKTGQRYKESTSANMYQTPSGVIRSSDLVDELLKNSGEVPKQLQSAYNAKANEVVRDLIMGKSSQEIANEIKNSKYGGMYQGLINAVESVAPKKAEGHLYTVDLPDEKIAQMLNWDRPLSEQASHIQDFARAHDPNFSSKEPHFVTPQGEVIHWSGLLDNPEDLQNPRLKAIGQKVYRGGDWVDYGDYMMNKTTGADLYRKLSSPSEWHNQVSAGTGKAGLEDVDASALLRAHGIPGIRYLDEMSRDAGQGTSNFVVFPGEEDALTILKREKEGGAIHMGAGGTIKKGIELVDTFLNALKEGEKPAKAAKAARPSREAVQVAAKAVKDAEQLAAAPVVQTVANPERMQYPGIYKRPDVIAAEAAARVAPESPMLKRLFGVTRNDLYEMGKGRQGNLPGALPGLAASPKGSKVSAQITTPQNTQRMIDVMSEAEKHPALVQGMDPWYVMDPLFQKWVKERGLERAMAEYNMQNHLFGMSSPGSEVMTEIPRGSAAYFLHKQGRFPDFEKYAGMPAHLRGEDFPQDILTVPGHAYHSTAQAGPMRKFLEKGELDMSSPKVPMYIQASGVPEVGFQTATPVGDAHWSRAVGLADVRGGSPANWKKSVSNTEMYDLGPWWREQVAAPLGLESVPAQARAWGAFSPQTGVTTPIGAPKLELIADQAAMAGQRLGISPEDALIMWINSQARLGKKEGGAVHEESDVDGFLDHINKAQY